jgi:hypothetical protein
MLRDAEDGAAIVRRIPGSATVDSSEKAATYQGFSNAPGRI